MNGYGDPIDNEPMGYSPCIKLGMPIEVFAPED